MGLPTPDPAIATELSFGSRGPAVTRLQERLRELGFTPGQSDGDFGDQTLSAVMNFQTSSGLKADGIVGPKTLTALGI
jgi:N-acetylmuramoyl-L-alanine amidase